MVGSGFGALIGGAISEKLDGSYELGAKLVVLLAVLWEVLLMIKFQH
ncbi:MAG: hypothetical protein NC247_06325 [Ruminococcus flavefaciens]|nr:hypothetical protein [Ruminococcus flavefaciens]MCM1361338.1 hypothetical protein [Clostridiales bacterium]